MRQVKQSRIANKRNRMSPALLVMVLLLAPVWQLASAPDSIAQTSASPAQPADESLDAEETPELSLETLYHPEKRVDYVTELPKTHWIAGPTPTLLVRREEGWNQVDLQTFSETPWEPADRLAKQLDSLNQVDEETARAAANDAIASFKSSDDTVLVRIDESLAVASPDGLTRWLTKDATSWNNVTLDPTNRLVAYTQAGDLHLLDVQTDRSWQLTDDQSETLLDGVLDWTYQEEIFGRGNYRGFWFSPDGRWLAMLRIDISGIEPYTLPSASSVRGEGIVRRYPKAGDPIPHAELMLWDLRQLDRGTVPPPRTLMQSTPQRERIVTGVWWHPQRNELLYAVSDRVQSWRELYRIDASSLEGDVADRLDPVRWFREESPAWVEPPADPTWLDDRLLWQSELPTGRTRVYQIDSKAKVVTPLTPDNFDVVDFAVDHEAHSLIVTGDWVVDSQFATGTVNQHAYRLALDRSTPIEMARLTSQPGWHEITFSPDAAWMVDHHSTPIDPGALHVRSTRDDAAHRLAVAELRLESGLIEPELFRIETPDGVSLPAMTVRPRTESKRASDRLPVVIEVYGGPRSPVVRSRFAGKRTLYRELLARNGIATLVVDNRSSAGNGLADTWTIQGRVGEVEVKDLLHAVDWLKAQAWVDKDRIAVRGWSFGGFLTLSAMTASDAFVAGIAGGSVTDWREYDAFYTERYMGLPEENEQGYDQTAPVRRADRLQGRVLLIHGEADDNVHPSGTFRMVDALQRAGKEFQLMIYPGAAHGISDPQQRWHLARTTHRFLLRELKTEPQ